MPISLTKLSAPCEATIIPAGEEVLLAEGTEVELVQNLGGSLTVKSMGVLYRIDAAVAQNLSKEQQLAFGLAIKGVIAAPDDHRDYSEELLWDTLKTCFDPEIPTNIVDLGLVYDLNSVPLDDGHYHVHMRMTLTARACGMGPIIANDAKRKLENLSMVDSASVEVVWDPPWTPNMISKEGRQDLGIST